MPRRITSSSARSSDINRDMDKINTEIDFRTKNIKLLNNVLILIKKNPRNTPNEIRKVKRLIDGISKHEAHLFNIQQELVMLQGRQHLHRKRKASRGKKKSIKQSDIDKAILKIQKIVRGKQARDKLNYSSSSLKEEHLSEDSSSRDSGNRRKHTGKAKHLREYMAGNKQHYDRVVRQLREGTVSLEGDKMHKLRYRKELGDGHCFFYAVRTNLHRIGLLGAYYEQKEPMIRERLVEELSRYTDRKKYAEDLDKGFWDIIKDYEENYFPLEVDGITSWSDYKKRLMAEKGCDAMWGGPLELYLVSLAYNVNVYFFKYKPQVTGAEPSVVVEKIGKNVGLKKARGKERSMYLWHHDTPSDYEKGAAHWATLEPIKSGSHKTQKKKSSSSRKQKKKSSSSRKQKKKSSSSSSKTQKKKSSDKGSSSKTPKYRKSGHTKRKLGTKVKK